MIKLCFSLFIGLCYDYVLYYCSTLHNSVALPIPNVTVMTTQGTPIIGEVFFLNCSAEFDRNIANITLEWLKDGSLIVSSNSDCVLTLNISSVNVSDNGMYTCVATLDIDGLTSTANNTYEFLILG